MKEENEHEIKRKREIWVRQTKSFKNSMLDSLTDKIKKLAKIDASNSFAFTDLVRTMENFRQELNDTMPHFLEEVGIK